MHGLLPKIQFYTRISKSFPYNSPFSINLIPYQKKEKKIRIFPPSKNPSNKNNHAPRT